MAKNKRNRLRNPSGKTSESASRDPSPSPSSAPAPGISSDQEGKPQVDSTDTDNEGTLSENAETAHQVSNSPATEAPVLTHNGPLNSPQNEPALGANDRPVGDSQSPTNTDQSLMGHPDNTSEPSPTFGRPSDSLAAEFERISMDSSEDDMQTEEQDQNTAGKGSPDADSAQQPPPGEKTGEAVIRSNDTTPGHTEDGFEQELRRRIAAEERVTALEAELKAQEQRYEQEAAAEKRRFERAMERANRAREADQMKFDEKYNENDKRMQDFQAEIQKHVENVARLTSEVAGAEDSAGEGARGGPSSRDRELEHERQELWNALQMELNPSAGGPPVTPRDYPRPGSARFLLAESEYLLDKNSRLYEALRAAAIYADGRGDWPSDGNKQLFEAFRDRLEDMNEFLEQNADRPQDCLREARRDWGVAAEENTW